MDDGFYKNAFINEALHKRYDSQILIHQAPCFSCISCPGKDILKSRFRADKNYSLTILSIVESYPMPQKAVQFFISKFKDIFNNKSQSHGIIGRDHTGMQRFVLDPVQPRTLRKEE